MITRCTCYYIIIITRYYTIHISCSKLIGDQNPNMYTAHPLKKQYDRIKIHARLAASVDEISGIRSLNLNPLPG